MNATIARSRPSNAQTSSSPRRASVNVGDTERYASLIGGGMLTVMGLRQGSLMGLGMAGLGAGLLYRGSTGHCSLYKAMGVTTAKQPSAQASIPAGEGIRVERSITIDKSPSELYRIWRGFERLPGFMSHLISVKSQGNRSHWVAQSPLGGKIEWDAELVNDVTDRLIAWRSLPGSEVDVTGSVRFLAAPGGQGCDVHVNLKYDPPGGKIGSWAAWLVGEEPGQQIEADLKRFKQKIESGEISIEPEHNIPPAYKIIQ